MVDLNDLEDFSAKQTPKHNIKEVKMKRAYMNPAMQVIRIQPAHLICNSGGDVINPGQPNQTAGARCYDFDDWDDEGVVEEKGW